MAVELVGIETCYRREEEIPARFKSCPCAAAVQITAPFCKPAIAARQEHRLLSRFRVLRLRRAASILPPPGSKSLPHDRGDVQKVQSSSRNHRE